MINYCLIEVKTLLGLRVLLLCVLIVDKRNGLETDFLNNGAFVLC